MAVEAKRKCGFRQAGGTYIVGPQLSRPCGLFPIPMGPCPCCGHEIRFQQSPMRINPREALPPYYDEFNNPACTLAEGSHDDPALLPSCNCPLGPDGSVRRAPYACLLWIGRTYSPAEIMAESRELGFSRRIPGQVPKWLIPGETWVIMAHLDAIEEPCAGADGLPCLGGKIRRPSGEPVVKQAAEVDLEKPQGGVLEFGEATVTITPLGPEEPCPACNGSGKTFRAGIIGAFKPIRIERIIDDTTPKEDREKILEEDPRLTLVEVPADDPDHHRPE